MTDEDGVADLLLDRERSGRAGVPITASRPALDVATGYEIQLAGLRRRLESGQRIAGVKLGRVTEPVTGWLTGAMALDPDRPVPLEKFIRPLVEPEIVFVLGERLARPGVTAETALAAVAEVRAGVEVRDSRYAGFRATVPDVVADNVSAAGYYLGERVLRPDELELAAEVCRLSVDGELAGLATAGAAARGLAVLANELARRGQCIEPGWLVLTGGLVDAVSIGSGVRVRVEFSTLGSVDLTA